MDHSDGGFVSALSNFSKTTAKHSNEVLFLICTKGSHWIKVTLSSLTVSLSLSSYLFHHCFPSICRVCNQVRALEADWRRLAGGGPEGRTLPTHGQAGCQNLDLSPKEPSAFSPAMENSSLSPEGSTRSPGTSSTPCLHTDGQQLGSLGPNCCQLQAQTPERRPKNVYEPGLGLEVTASRTVMAPVSQSGDQEECSCSRPL